MTAASLLNGPQALYRFFDRAGRLLYVGITGNIGVRWTAHNTLKPWWSDVATCTVEHFPTRDEVLAAERTAIETEHPLHNVTHNRRKPGEGVGDRMPTAAGGQLWSFSSLRSGYERTVPLWLHWEVECDPISDRFLPDEIDAIELWDLWRRQYPPEADAPYGPGTHRIWWHVRGPNVFEHAPGEDYRGVPYPPRKNFLTSFTWPRDSETGEELNWLTLPVVDKRWHAGRGDKGGFIQEATGFKPGPFQPYVNVFQLEQLAGL